MYACFTLNYRHTPDPCPDPDLTGNPVDLLNSFRIWTCWPRIFHRVRFGFGVPDPGRFENSGSGVPLRLSRPAEGRRLSGTGLVEARVLHEGGERVLRLDTVRAVVDYNDLVVQVVRSVKHQRGQRELHVGQVLSTSQVSHQRHLYQQTTPRCHTCSTRPHCRRACEVRVMSVSASYHGHQHRSRVSNVLL